MAVVVNDVSAEFDLEANVVLVNRAQLNAPGSSSAIRALGHRRLEANASFKHFVYRCVIVEAESGPHSRGSAGPLMRVYLCPAPCNVVRVSERDHDAQSSYAWNK